MDYEKKARWILLPFPSGSWTASWNPPLERIRQRSPVDGIVFPQGTAAVALSGSYPFPADENIGKRDPHTRAFSPKYTSYQTRKLYTVQILRLLSFFPA